MSVRGFLISTDSTDSFYDQYQELATTPKSPHGHGQGNRNDYFDKGEK